MGKGADEEDRREQLITSQSQAQVSYGRRLGVIVLVKCDRGDVYYACKDN